MLDKDKEDKLIEIFVTIDDFYQHFVKWIQSHEKTDSPKPRFKGIMHPREVLSMALLHKKS